MKTAKKRQSIILRVITSLFCKHDYNIINQELLKSEFEIVSEMVDKPNTWTKIQQKIIT